MLLLAYDGTLVPLASRPAEASPPAELVSLLLHLGAAGDRVHLRVAAEGLSRGWARGGARILSLAPDTLHGTSNRMAAEAGTLRLAFDAPGMLVILPRSELAAAIAGLERPASG